LFHGFNINTRSKTLDLGVHGNLFGGRIVKMYGEVVKIGIPSTTIKLEARAYNTFTGKETTIFGTDMVFVRIDDDGSPIPIDKTKVE